MKVKEVFYSIQGEGRNAGRPAVFCRFVGCNLWSGREQDRQSAICKFCDTDFLGGFSICEDDLVDLIMKTWMDAPDLTDCAIGGCKKAHPLVVFTGGEPGLQLTDSIIHKLRIRGFNVSVETNGTVPLPKGVYWITVSPKVGTDIVVKSGHELKVVWPQDFDLEYLESFDFRDFYLQPMDGISTSLKDTVNTVLSRPVWKLSLQMHKIIGVR